MLELANAIPHSPQMSAILTKAMPLILVVILSRAFRDEVQEKGLRAFHTEFTEGKLLTTENTEKSPPFLCTLREPISVRSV